jgi:hypothetical protein
VSEQPLSALADTRPAWHGAHVVDAVACADAEYVPGAHGVQASAPTADW